VLARNGTSVFLPEKLQGELDLAGCGGGAGDGAGGSGDSRGSEDDQIGRVEVGAVEDIEELSAELEGETFAEGGVLCAGEVPGGEAGATQSIAAEVAVEAAIGWRRQECGGIEPLGRLCR